MRHLGWLILLAWTPSWAVAQDALIRIEAKRGAAAAEAAVERWSGKFDDVVTFRLGNGWTAIALGPQLTAEAEQRLSQLKKTQQIPADSFVTAVPSGVQVTPAQPAEATQPNSATPDTAVPAAAVAPAQHFIRLQSLPDRQEAESALTEWRKKLPEAGLWMTPEGWFGIAVGPFDAATAQAWTERLKQTDVLPKDAFTSELAELGKAEIQGKAPDWGKATEAAPMPPIEDMQAALAWAGLYSGQIDGKTGPQTRAAIDAAIVLHKASPDPATAMRALFARRDAWRDSFGLATLDDAHTELQLTAPLAQVQFDRTERALSIYGPKDNSGAALILFGQPGGQQELQDMSGLVTALGWVPNPERLIARNHIRLAGQNDHFIGHAEGWVREGRIEGFVLVWPVKDAQNQSRVASEIRESLSHRPAVTAAQPDLSGENPVSLSAPEAETRSPETPSPLSPSAGSTAPETRQEQDKR